MKGYSLDLSFDEPEASGVRMLFGPALTTLRADPHISLAVFHCLEPPALIEYCGMFFRSVAPHVIEFRPVTSLG
jgi:hypothetical protein